VAAKESRAFSHPEQSDRLDARQFGLRYAASIVSDRQRQHSAALAHADPNGASIRVANDICERFLQDPEQSELPWAIGQAVVQVPQNPAPYPGAGFKLRRFPLDGLLQSEVIEDCRPQVAGYLPDRLDADFNQTDERLQLVDQLNPGFRLAPAQFVYEPHELQLEAGEYLAELIVQFPSDSCALLFARALESKRQ
jgi:hypothetical protein